MELPGAVTPASPFRRGLEMGRVLRRSLPQSPAVGGALISSCCRHRELARANAFSEIPGVRQHDDGVHAASQAGIRSEGFLRSASLGTVGIRPPCQLLKASRSRPSQSYSVVRNGV